MCYIAVWLVRFECTAMPSAKLERAKGVKQIASSKRFARPGQRG
jgi:hypothetical protein